MKAGSVLILALWTLLFLGALALAVGAYVSGGIAAARAVQAESTARYAAVAGVERAIREIAARTNAWDGVQAGAWNNDGAVFRDAPVGNGSFSVAYAYGRVNGTATNFGVIGEERAVNLNRAGSALLASLLEIAGGLSPASASETAAAILDWRDRNDEVELTGGAENEYYAGQNPAYPCHNDFFESRHELLLVKGFTRELFLKLAPYVTLCGTGRVNINAADPVVLACVAHSCGRPDRTVCESLSRHIAEFREGIPLDSNEALRALRASLPAREARLLSKMEGRNLLTMRSTCMGGVSTGRSGDAEADPARPDGRGTVRRITFVFDRNAGKLVYWFEE